MPKYHYNLQRLAKRLKDGMTKMAWLGDSISFESTPRWAESVMKYWDIPWCGRFVPSGSFNSSDAGVRDFDQTVFVANVYKGGPTIDGGALHWPRSWWEEQRASNVSLGLGSRRWELTALDTYFRGNWAGSGEKPLTARILTYDGTTTIGGRIRLSQNSTGSDYLTNNSGAASEANYTGTQNILDYEISATGNVETTTSWDTVIEGSNSVDESTGPQNIGGVLYYDAAATKGLQLGFIAEGGWDSHDHRSGLVGDPSYVSDGQFSDQAIFNYCKHLRSIDTVVISIANSSSDENGTGDTLRDQFKANLTHIITRWRTQMLAAAAANGDTIEPLFFLLCPWTTINTTTRPKRDELYNAALLLQSERNDVCTLYMNEIMDRRYGDWDDWSPTFLADTTHQAAAGIQPFGETLWNEIEAAYDEATPEVDPVTVISPANPAAVATPPVDITIKTGIRKLVMQGGYNAPIFEFDNNTVEASSPYINASGYNAGEIHFDTGHAGGTVQPYTSADGSTFAPFGSAIAVPGSLPGVVDISSTVAAAAYLKFVMGTANTTMKVVLKKV